jgi:hypothetical protein
MDYVGADVARASSGTGVRLLTAMVRCTAWWSVGPVVARVLRNACRSAMKSCLMVVASSTGRAHRLPNDDPRHHLPISSPSANITGRIIGRARMMNSHTRR